MGTPQLPSLGWRDNPSDVHTECALILVPGLGTTSSIFDGLVNGLRRRFSALSIVRADLPGHGTGRAAELVDIGALSDEVSHVVSRLDAAQTVVVGLSMGGAIALETARRAPRGLRGFAMINSGVRFGTIDGWRRIIEEALSRPQTSETEGLRNTGSIDLATYVACCRALASYDGEDGVGEIPPPALLVGTADDEATPASGLRDLALRLRRADYFEIPDGGHHSIASRPRVVEDLVMRTFFSQLVPVR